MAADNLDTKSNKLLDSKDSSFSNFGNAVSMFINGKLFVVADPVPPYTTLNTFIRSYAQLPGTKHMCNEGGCGACVVSVSHFHPVTGQKITMSVNSCLVLVYACHGWSIKTVEGIGNKKDGYNKVQTTLAHFNGSQCGYCSPGFVMNMYSLLESNKNVTMEEIEKSFSGHICRCTGYRPILDAFKSLASDASDDLKAKSFDIEDFLQICPKSGTQCKGKCELSEKERAIYDCVKNVKDGSEDDEILKKFKTPESLKIKSNLDSSAVWFKTRTVPEIFQVLLMVPDNQTYMFVAGNTAQGAYRNTKDIQYYIDIKDVPQLRTHSIGNDGIHLGANMTLTETIQIFKATAMVSPQSFWHLRILAEHIELVANVSVRNVGTLAGNLILKREHQDFPSDIFLTLETVGAFLQIENGYGLSDSIPLQALFQIVMHKKLITSIIIPALPPNLSFKTYKIMPRAQNAPAILNAGFLFNTTGKNGYQVVSKPSIVFGGISPNFIHATNLESYLIGKELMNDSSLQQALKVLDKELMRYKDPKDELFDYKRKLAEGLFYRFILSLNPEKVQPKYQSGAFEIKRGLSKGHQEYSTDRTKWPVYKPIPKIEALAQCSGEAQYTNDIPHYPGELQGALVVTKLSVGKIVSIDPAPALKLPGVVAFYSAKDIPGENRIIAPNVLFPEKEELFCSGQILYTGQPVGIIVAETREMALKGADLVKISYADIRPPKLHVKDTIKSGIEDFVKLAGSVIPDLLPPKADIKFLLKGTVESPSQYHFTMEVQSCLCVPKEGEMYVYSATQWISCVQDAISVVLNIPASKVNLSTKRLGGGYGSKISRASMIATACSVASYITQRPVRLVLSIETNMAAVGKRHSCYAEYEAGIIGTGKILALNVTVYEDNGCSINENASLLLLDALPGIYDSKTWFLKALDTKTDKASAAWTRAPGTIEGTVVIETIMEHVASKLNKDPLEVRMANADKSDPKPLELIKKIIESSDYKKRKAEIEAFNKVNRWKKKGISIIPMKFTNLNFGPLHVLIAIYAQDGSVTVCHGGIEMGQGMNTKISQVVAYKLGVDMEKISVKATNSMTSPNNTLTGASTTSENVCKAAIMACDELVVKLQPIKKELGGGSSWLDIIKKAYASSIDLLAVAHVTELGGFKTTYKSYGACVSEVIVDLLTGKHLLFRVDILEDAGKSLSPEIDVGQVEGAFMMGCGLVLYEELKYDEKTGELKTNRTWNYHPPGAMDIPENLYVTLLQNSSNPEGVLSSKAAGEPPLLLTTSVLFAIRDAVKKGRKDAGITDDWFEFDPPVTPPKILTTCQTSYDQFKFHS